MLHNLWDVKVRVKTDLRFGGLNTGVCYNDIEPGKCFKKQVTTTINYITQFQLTEDGSLDIEGTVSLIGQAVAVGRDALGCHDLMRGDSILNVNFRFFCLLY